VPFPQQVHLVVADIAVFGRPQVAGDRTPIDSLRIAMSPRPDRRAERIVVRHAAVVVQAKHFAVHRRQRLRIRRVRGIAHRQVQLAVRSEADASAVVNRGRGHSFAQDCALGECVVEFAIPRESIDGAA
jgi:hypothetical protein